MCTDITTRKGKLTMTVIDKDESGWQKNQVQCVPDTLRFVFNSKVLCQTIKEIITFLTHIKKVRNVGTYRFHRTMGPGNSFMADCQE